MATLDDLRGLDYAVELAFAGDGFEVYRVEGLGVSTQVRDDDEDAIASLLDGHDERVRQQGETRAETLLRHAGEGNLELSDDHRRVLEQQARQEREALETTQP